jgi:hypothetical protein
MNDYMNSEVTCRLPPMTRFERLLMVTLYASSAATVITVAVLLWRSF